MKKLLLIAVVFFLGCESKPNLPPPSQNTMNAESMEKALIEFYRNDLEPINIASTLDLK